MAQVKLDDLVAAYIKVRDKRDALMAEHKKQLAAVNQVLEKIEAALLGNFNALGLDSATARGVGTAYKYTKTSATVADRESFFKWVGEDFEDRVIFLEARANKTAVDQYKTIHGDLPPGVNWREVVEIGVRRDTSSN